jgi:succinoglycan biosynthesis transport protein ExoP
MNLDNQLLPNDAYSFDQPTGADADAGHRRHKLHMLLRGRYHWAILLAVVLGLLGAAAGYIKVQPEYSSTAQVRINPTLTTIMQEADDAKLGRQLESYITSEIQRIASTRVLGWASQDARWVRAVGQLEQATSIGMMRNSLKIDHDRRTVDISISFVGSTPQVAMAGAQAVLDAYKRVHVDQDADIESKRYGVLYQLQTQERQEITNLKIRQYELLRDYGTDMALRDEYVSQAEKRRQLEDAAAALQMVDDSQSALGQLLMVDRKLQIMVEMSEQKQREVDLLISQGIGENHRTMKVARAALAILKAEINRYIESGGNLELTPSEGDREETLKAQIEKQKKHVRDLAARIEQLDQINGQIATAQDGLNRKTARIAELRAEESMRGRLVVLSEGDQPIEPYNRKTRAQAAGIGGFGGFVMGFAIMMFIGICDRKLRHADEVECGMPSARMLGILPSLPDNLTDPQQAALAAHAVHHIRTLLQIEQAPNDGGRVFSVTGAAAGSGKTSLSVALGLSFAASSSRTLLIDCDIVASGLTRRLNTIIRPPLGSVLVGQGVLTDEQLAEFEKDIVSSNGQLGQALIKDGRVSEEQIQHAEQIRQGMAIGLLDACSGNDFDRCIAPTDIPNLSVLPIGSAMPHQAGALSPDALRRIIAIARQQFDIVFLDTGPVLGSLEASIAATAADGVIMVVSRGDQKVLAYKSLEHLRSINARIAGMVFNHALDEDMARTSYAATSNSQSRRSGTVATLEVIDPQQSARYGPLISAVVSYGSTTSTIQR